MTNEKNWKLIEFLNEKDDWVSISEIERTLKVSLADIMNNLKFIKESTYWVQHRSGPNKNDKYWKTLTDMKITEEGKRVVQLRKFGLVKLGEEDSDDRKRDS